MAKYQCECDVEVGYICGKCAWDSVERLKIELKHSQDGAREEQDKLKAELASIKTPTCESLGYHICGPSNEGKLHEALKEITIHTNPQIMLRIAGEALKGDKL